MSIAVATARAIGVYGTGGPEVLGVFEREVRGPGPGEVRVAVRAASVNPTDVLLRTHGPLPGPDGTRGEPPWVPGADAAGVIESVGEGVDRLSVGEAVMMPVRAVMPDGGAQSELVVVPAASVVPMPSGVTFEQASILPSNGLTALLGLDMLGLTHGQTLAVTGASGIVASCVIPLAKQRKIRVIADAREQDEALVRSLGADVIVPRGDGYVTAVREQAPGGVDGFFDTALLTHRLLPAIRDGGGIAAMRGWETVAHNPLTWDTPTVEAERGIKVHQVWVRTVFERTEWLEQLSHLASDGVLRLRVAATFPPERAADAQELMSAGGIRGRVVITFPER